MGNGIDAAEVDRTGAVGDRAEKDSIGIEGIKHFNLDVAGVGKTGIEREGTPRAETARLDYDSAEGSGGFAVLETDNTRRSLHLRLEYGSDARDVVVGIGPSASVVVDDRSGPGGREEGSEKAENDENSYEAAVCQQRRRGHNVRVTVNRPWLLAYMAIMKLHKFHKLMTWNRTRFSIYNKGVHGKLNSFYYGKCKYLLSSAFLSRLIVFCVRPCVSFYLDALFHKDLLVSA
jgi:hypothetical protein